MTPACGELRTDARPAWLVWVSRISIVIGLGALIATVWIVGVGAIAEHVRHIGWLFMLFVAIDVLSSVCDATAIYYMADGPSRPRWRDTVVAVLAGRGINAVTPGGNLGEALKVSLLSRCAPPRRVVAAVMYAASILVVFSLALIAIGTTVTAILYDGQPAVMISLFVCALVASAIAIAIVVLLRTGMLSALTDALARLHLVSRERRDKWRAIVDEIDARMRGRDIAHRHRAIGFLALSQVLHKTLTFVIVLAAGYTLSPGQFLALVSAGVVVAWISTLVPMGLGVSEAGHVAVFAWIGAPASLGIAVALARRVNQIVFAAIGFVVLVAYGIGVRVRDHVDGMPVTKPVPT